MGASQSSPRASIKPRFDVVEGAPFSAVEAYNTCTYRRGNSAFLRVQPSSHMSQQDDIAACVDGTELWTGELLPAGKLIDEIRSVVGGGEVCVIGFGDADLSNGEWKRVVDNFRRHVRAFGEGGRLIIMFHRLIGGVQAFQQRFPFMCVGDELFERGRKYPTLVHTHEATSTKGGEALLFVSCLPVAVDPNVMNAVGITHVVNCTPNEPFAEGVNHEFAKFRVPVFDTEDDNLTPFLQETFEFIRAALENNGKVLVHCNHGRSRSVSIAAGVISICQNCTLKEALASIAIARPVVCPNHLFLEQIEAYFASQCRSGSSSESSSSCAADSN